MKINNQSILPIHSVLKRVIHILVILLQACLVLFSLGILYASFFEKELIKTGMLWIQHQILSFGSWNIFFAFLASCIESFPLLGTLLPGQNIMVIISGTYGRDHAIVTVLACIIGTMAGNGIGYTIGKKWGLNLLEKYGYLFGVEKTERRILEEQVSKNGPWFIVIAKFNNITRSLIPFLAGSIHMHDKKFWIYNTIGAFIYAITMTLIGILLFDQYEIILDNFEKIMLGFFLILGLYIFVFKKQAFQKYYQEKKKEWEENAH